MVKNYILWGSDFEATKKVMTNPIALRSGNIFGVKKRRIAPPVIGVIIYPKLFKALLIPNIVADSVLSTLFVNLLVKIGRTMPDP